MRGKIGSPRIPVGCATDPAHHAASHAAFVEINSAKIENTSWLDERKSMSRTACHPTDVETSRSTSSSVAGLHDLWYVEDDLWR